MFVSGALMPYCSVKKFTLYEYKALDYAWLSETQGYMSRSLGFLEGLITPFARSMFLGIQYVRICSA